MSNVTVKFLLAGLLALLILIPMALFIGSLRGKVEPLAIEVRPGPFEVKVQVNGSLRAQMSSPVTVRSGGHVLVWLLPEGTMVKKGDMLARFDDTSISDKVAERKIDLKIAQAGLRKRQEELKAGQEDLKARITMLEADREIAETELKRLKGLPRKEDLERAELDHDYAIKILESVLADLERLKALDIKGVVMASELKDKEMAVVTAKADREMASIQLQLVRDGATEQQLETARLRAEQVRIDLDQARHELPGQLRGLQAKVTEAQAQVDKSRNRLGRSEKFLGDLHVKSPADGMLVYRTIRGRKIVVGATFWRSAHLFDVVDLSKMFVQVKVLESEVRSVKENQKVEIRVVTMPERVLMGTVTKVAKVGKDKSEGELMTRQEMRTKAGVQAFDVRVTISESDPRLRPNVGAEVTILVEKLENVIKVPLDGVFRKDGKPVVNVLSWRGARIRPVKLGTVGSDWVVVTDGLSEGDRVLLTLPEGQGFHTNGAEPETSTSSERTKTSPRS